MDYCTIFYNYFSSTNKNNSTICSKLGYRSVEEYSGPKQHRIHRLPTLKKKPANKSSAQIIPFICSDTIKTKNKNDNLFKSDKNT